MPYRDKVLITLRVTVPEREQLKRSADAVGLSLQQLIYNRVFDVEPEELEEKPEPGNGP